MGTILMDAKTRDLLGKVLAGFVDAFGLPIVIEVLAEVVRGEHR